VIRHFDKSKVAKGKAANGFIFAERLSSAMTALGAERAARSTICDKRGHSL